MKTILYSIFIVPGVLVIALKWLRNEVREKGWDYVRIDYVNLMKYLAPHIKLVEYFSGSVWAIVLFFIIKYFFKF